MKFSAKEMRAAQKEAIRCYENDLKMNISKRLRERAQQFPYTGKLTIVFADENKRENSRLDRPCIFFVSLSIFTKEMFDRLADWFASEGYSARKDWFLDQNNHSGDIGTISLSW